MVGFMTKIETHTQPRGGVIATARIGTRVIRVCGEKPFRGCFVCEQLTWFIAHALAYDITEATGLGRSSSVREGRESSRDQLRTQAP
jgi:hypothetical protein